MQTPPSHPDSQSDAERLLGIVRGLARELRPNAPAAEHLSLDHLLERDFGLDSLARVELLIRIERELGAKLGEKAFVDAETPRDLLRQIAGAASAETPTPVGTPVFAEAKVYHPPQAASTLIEILDWHVARHAVQIGGISSRCTIRPPPAAGHPDRPPLLAVRRAVAAAPQ